MYKDPVVEQVRKWRQAVMKKHDYDFERVGAMLMEMDSHAKAAIRKERARKKKTSPRAGKMG